jgi:two-component system, NtrC family, sensor kinase
MARINDVKLTFDPPITDQDAATGVQYIAFECAIDFEAYEWQANWPYMLYLSITDLVAAGAATPAWIAQAPCGFNPQVHSHVDYYRHTHLNQQLLLVLTTHEAANNQAHSLSNKMESNGVNGQPMANGSTRESSPTIATQDQFTRLSVKELIYPHQQARLWIKRQYKLRIIALPLSYNNGGTAASVSHAFVAAQPQPPAYGTFLQTNGLNNPISPTPAGWVNGYGTQPAPAPSSHQQPTAPPHNPVLNNGNGSTPLYGNTAPPNIPSAFLPQQSPIPPFSTPPQYNAPATPTGFSPATPYAQPQSPFAQPLPDNGAGIYTSGQNVSPTHSPSTQPISHPTGISMGSIIISESFRAQHIDPQLIQLLELDPQAAYVSPIQEWIAPHERLSLTQALLESKQGQRPIAIHTQWQNGYQQSVPVQLLIQPQADTWHLTLHQPHIIAKEGSTIPGIPQATGNNQVEQRLRKMVEEAPVGICVTDDGGNFVSVNQAYCKIYGYKPEELIGKPFTVVVAPDTKMQWLKTHDRFLAGETHTKGEFDVFNKYGEKLTVLADSARIVDEKGKFQKITFVQDITERKKIEQELQVSALTQTKLIQSAPVGICITDSDYRFERVNQTYCDIYGYEEQDLIGKSFTIVVPKDRIDFWKRKHDLFIAGQDETRGEFEVVHKSGRMLTILADSTRIAGTDGQPKKVTFVIDISDRKQNEENLKSIEEELRQNLEEMQATQEQMRRSQMELTSSEGRFRQLISQAPVGICVTDQHGHFESINETYCEIYHYTPEELIGKHFSMVVPKDKISFWQQKHDQFLAGRDETKGEFNVVDKHGKLLTILADSMRITGSDGQPRKVTFVVDITERKETERLLQIGEESQRKLIQTAPVGICITGDSYTFERVNQTYCQIYGYEEAELIGQPFTLVVPEDKIEYWKRKHDLFIAGQDETRGEFMVRHKSGRMLTILADSTRIQGIDGQPKKVTFVIDITERKQNEENLKAIEEELRQNLEEMQATQEQMRRSQQDLVSSEGRFRQLISQAPVGICVTDQNGLFESINETYTEIYHYTPEELIGKHFSIVVPKEKHEFWKQKHDLFIAGRDETQGEYNVIDKHGKLLTILADSMRISGNDGQPRKVTFVIDITDRKETEKQLQLSEETQRKLFETAPVGVCITGDNYCFESINDTYCHIYGYDKHELVGQPFTIVVLPEKIDFWKKKHDEFIAGRDETRGEFTVVHKSGRKLTILADSTRITGLDGKPKKVTFVVDITERKHAEENLKAVESELRQNIEEMAATQEKMKRSQVELQQSEVRFRQLIEQAPVAICVVDAQAQFESTNDTFAQIFGYATQDILEQTFTLIFPKGDEPKWQTLHQDFIQGKSEIHGEFNAVDRKNKPLTIIVEATRIAGADAQPRMVMFIVDITERKRTEQLLKRSEERLSSLISRAPVAICILNQDGEFESLNEVGAKTFGLDMVEAVSQPFTALIPTAKRDAWRDHFEAFMLDQRTLNGEWMMADMRKRSLTILIEATRIIGSDNQPKAVLFMLDITERKKTELELKRSEERIASLVETAPVGICILKEDLTFESINDTFSKVFNYTLEEMGDKPFTSLVPATQVGKWEELLQGFVLGEREIKGEFTLIDRKGKNLTVLADAARVTGSDNKPRAVIFVVDITQRKEAEKEMERLSIIAQKTDNGIVLMDKTGIVEYVNEGFSHMTGFQLEEIRGKSPFEQLTGALTDSRAIARIEQGMKNDKSFTDELLEYRKDGLPIWVSLSITPVMDKKGFVDKYILLQSDITQRKAAETEMQKLSLVAAKTDNVVIITDAKGYIEWVNDAFTTVTEYELADVLGKKPGAFLQGKETDAETVSTLRTAIAAHEPVSVDIINYSKSGRRYWINVNITPSFDKEGKLDKFVAVQREITLQKEIEQQKQQERLKLEKSNNDLQKALEELRQAQAELVGKQELELMNANLESSNDDLKRAMNDLKVAQDQLIVSEKMAALGQLIAGVAHEVNTPISAIKASIRNMFSTLPDTMNQMPDIFSKVTKAQQPLLKQLLESTIAASEKLTTSEERAYRNQITEILENANLEDAEDIASSLVEVGIYNSIEDYIPLLTGKSSMDIIDLIYKLGQLKVSMTNIDIASEKTAKIVSALKNYSYVQASDHLVDTDVRTSVDTVLTLYNNQLKYGILVEKEYADDLPKIPLYPDEIGQVWTNIIQNGIQAMKGEGKLHIHIRKEGEMVAVSITDNGPGIPPDIMKRVFEPFFTTKAQGEGTGLGLDISRKIVEKHLGTIGLTSEPGKTTFTVSLPMKALEK